MLLRLPCVAAVTSAECLPAEACSHALPKMLYKLCGALTPSVPRAHGVVASHPLRMRKALGSNPSGSIWLAEASLKQVAAGTIDVETKTILMQARRVHFAVNTTDALLLVEVRM